MVPYQAAAASFQRPALYNLELHVLNAIFCLYAPDYINHCKLDNGWISTVYLYSFKRGTLLQHRTVKSISLYPDVHFPSHKW